MGKKREKRLKSAGRQIERGQFEKALFEYRDILAENPDDLDILFKMSDLQARLGMVTEAAATLFRAGVLLARDEHHLRAVSTFNAVLKMDPRQIDAVRYLADLTMKLGMQEEARQHLQQLALHYDARGENRQALNVYRLLSDLDPSNVANLVKLAELYSSHDKKSHAVKLLKKASIELKKQGKLNEYVKVLERLIYIDDSNINALKELANIYMQIGEHNKALARLQTAFRLDREDLEVLELLSSLFMAIGENHKAIQTLKTMATIHQEAYALDKVHAIYKRVLEIDPGDADARAFFGA